MIYLVGAYVTFLVIMLIFAFLLYRKRQELAREQAALTELEQERARKLASVTISRQPASPLEKVKAKG